MTEITRILCPVDFSECSARALAFAMRVGAWYGAKLRVVHVQPPLPPSTLNALAATSRDLAAKNLQAQVERCRLPGVEVEAVLVESAETPERILESAESFDADLIVTGSHGRSGVQRVLLGSVVEALLHRVVRPVLVVPMHLDTPSVHNATFARIVCAVDFAAASLNALALALSLAEESDARLTLLHVVEAPASLSHAPQPLDRFVAPIRAQAKASAMEQLQHLVPEHAVDYCHVETAVVEGTISGQLLRTATERQADLIVMGVHGRNAFDLAFFGSTSKDVIRQATCPVLIVPASRRGRLTSVAS